MTEPTPQPKEPRVKLTEEERKAKQKEHAKRWYAKKKAAEAKGKPLSKKTKSNIKKLPRFILLSFLDKKQLVSLETDGNIEESVMEIFKDYPNVQHVALMKADCIYVRPELKVHKL